MKLELSEYLGVTHVIQLNDQIQYKFINSESSLSADPNR